MKFCPITMNNYQSPDSDQSRVSKCGKFIYLSNGAKFKRTVLPSVAEPRKEEIDVEEALEDVYVMRTKELE